MSQRLVDVLRKIESGDQIENDLNSLPYLENIADQRDHELLNEHRRNASIEYWMDQNSLVRKVVNGEITFENALHELIGQYGGWRSFIPMWRNQNYYDKVRELGLSHVVNLGEFGIAESHPDTQPYKPKLRDRFVDLLYNIPVPAAIFTAAMLLLTGNFVGSIGAGLSTGSFVGLAGGGFKLTGVKRIMEDAIYLDQQISIYRSTHS